MTAYLSARKINKSFLFGGNKIGILSELDFDICEGEFVSILGSSGCGKSTLLELFAGITRPDNGSILLCGDDITGQSGHLGYMPQEDLLFPWLSTEQNVLLPARIKKRDLAQARAEIKRLLPVFGLENHSKLLPYQLSGGLKQRVALLRTYMTGSHLLLLDEPFASLDAITRLQMQEWLLRIKEKLELTIILVTHDISEAIKLSDRIELMDKSPGRFIKTYSLSLDLKNNPTEFEMLKKEIVARL